MSSPNKSSEPGGTSFTKDFRFRGKLCFMRSHLRWSISRVEMPSSVTEFIRSVKTSLKSPPFSKSLSQGVNIAYETLAICSKAFWSVISVDLWTDVRFKLQILALRN